jgi:flagellar biosynthesis protein FliQ
MNPEFAVELLKNTILQAVSLASPILAAALIVGLLVSLFQAVTSIHEQTLSFVPKVLAVVGVLLLLLPWMARSLIEFTNSVFEKIPQMIQ